MNGNDKKTKEGENVKQTDGKVEKCDCVQIHEDIIEKVDRMMPDEDVLYNLADFFKVFSDSSRIKILYVLMCSEMCVCDLANTLSMSQSAISHQLSILKQQDLVKYKRSGKSVIYSLSDDHIKTIMRQGYDHIME